MTEEARTPEEASEQAPSSGTASSPLDDEALLFESGDGFPEASSLERELEKVRSEATSHLDDAKRIKADFENFRKRVQREQVVQADRAATAMVEKLLPVLDAFRLALIAADRTKDYDGLVRGVELVYGELIDAMRKEGLEEIEADGKPFDPEVHEAVMESESSKPDGEPFVEDVMRTGYRFKGRVLRPAMVKVERR